MKLENINCGGVAFSYSLRGERDGYGGWTPSFVGESLTSGSRGPVKAQVVRERLAALTVSASTKAEGYWTLDGARIENPSEELGEEFGEVCTFVQTKEASFMSSPRFTAQEIEQMMQSAIDETIEIINLTPHDIQVAKEGDVITTFPTSGTVARVETMQEPKAPIKGFAVASQKFGEVTGLLPKKINVYYIVSALVLNALKGSRTDVIAPDTGPSALRANGQIVAVRGFVQ